MEIRTKWYDSLPSTNTFLRENFNHQPYPTDGTLIAARAQTAGRGRQNRTWMTLPDTNLCFSLYLQSNAGLMQIPSLTMAVSLAICDALIAEDIPAEPKWPNDVLVNGKKICGILSERIEPKDPTHSGVIIGIGLNVNMDTETAASIDRPATSMRIETGKTYDLTQTLESLFSPLSKWVDQWKQNGFEGFQETWTQRAGPIGKPLTVHDGNLLISGTLAGFGPHGELLLQTEHGPKTIWSGDVAF